MQLSNLRKRCAFVVSQLWRTPDYRGRESGESDACTELVEALEERVLLAAPEQVAWVNATGDFDENAGTFSITVTWAPSPNATSYKIERSGDGDTWFQVAHLPSGETEFVDDGEDGNGRHLATGINYRYRVVAAHNGMPDAAPTETSGPLSFNSSAPGRRFEGFVEHDGQIFRVFLLALNELRPNTETWVVSHGLNSNSAAMQSLTQAIRFERPSANVLLVDWESAAAGATQGRAVAERIPAVSAWTAKVLQTLGIQGEHLHYAGHSFGSYIVNEIADNYASLGPSSPVWGRAETLIALDPGADPPGGTFNPNDSVDFRVSTSQSWVFRSTDWQWNSEDTSLRADYRLLMQFPDGTGGIPQHTGVWRTFVSLIGQARTPVHDLFDLDDLQSPNHSVLGTARAVFRSNGSGTPSDPAPAGQGYHGLLRVDGLNGVESFEYYDADGRLRRTSADPEAGPVSSDFSIDGGSQVAQAKQSSNTFQATFDTRDIVTNYSTSSSGPVEVAFYASRTGLDSSPLYRIGSRNVSSIESYARSTGRRTFRFEDIPAAAISGGQVYIGVAVNPSGTPDAADIRWERLSVPAAVGTPDLIGTDIDIEPDQGVYGWGQSARVSFRVQNIGLGYAGPFKAALYLSNDGVFGAGDRKLAEQTFDGLTGNSNRGAEFFFSFPSTPPAGFADGNATLLLVIDPDNQVAEANEGNNSGRQSGDDHEIIVLSSNLSANGDPSIGSFQSSATTIIRGERIWLTALNVVDDGVVNDVIFTLDDGSGHLDANDRYLGHGSRVGTTADLRLDTDTLPTGDLLIFAQAIDNEGNRSLVKSLVLTVLGNGPATPDAYERNDTESTAVHLGGAGDYVIRNLSITNGDVDWFSFDFFDGDGEITFEIRFFEEADTRNGNLTLTVRRLRYGGSSSSAVGFADRSSVTPGNTFERIEADASAGRYFIRIAAGSTWTSVRENPNYSLHVSVAPKANSTIVGNLVASRTEFHAGEQIGLWFDSVSNIGTFGESQAIFYRANRPTPGAHEFLGQDYGPNPSFNGFFGVSVDTTGWETGTHDLFGYYLGGGRGQSLPRSLRVRVLPSLAPEIGSLSAATSATQGDLLTLTAHDVTDPDGTVARVQFFRRDGGNLVLLGNGVRSGADWSLTADTSSWALGQNELVAIATDDLGGTSREVRTSIELLAVVDQAPTALGFGGPTAALFGSQITFRLDGLSDPDGDALLAPVVIWDRDSNGVAGDSDLVLGNMVALGNGDYELRVDSSTLAAGVQQFLVKLEQQDENRTAVLSTTVLLRQPGPRAELIGLRNHNWWLSTAGEPGAVGTTLWGQWDNRREFHDILSGDFDGDGRIDIAARSGAYWWVATASDAGAGARIWSEWSSTAPWQTILAADFNGDGRTDVAGFANGNWWVGLSNGFGFDTQLWTRWSRAVDWKDLRTADFDGDGRQDIIGRANGNWWVALSRFDGPQTVHFGSWSTRVTWTETKLGDFNGDGLDDIAGFVNGNWWLSQGNRILRRGYQFEGVIVMLARFSADGVPDDRVPAPLPLRRGRSPV